MKDLDIRVEEIEKKKEKKKKKFSFKRFFAYMGVYVLLSFCFCFVIVLGTDTTSSIDVPKLDIEEEEPSAFANVVNNLMAMQNFSTDLNLTLNNENNSDTFIDGNLKVVLYEGYTGAEVEANINVSYNSENYELFLLYKNDQIYISLNDYNYTFNASSFISGTIIALQAFGIEVGDLDSLIENFDMSILNDLESMLSEESFENYKLLTLKVSDNIEIKIQTDLNYNIIKIYIENLKLENTFINASLGLKDINAGQIIEIPQDKNFVDITESANLIKVLANTLKQDFIDVNINVCGSQNFSGNLFVDKSNNFKAQITTNIFNKNLLLAYQNEMLFAGFGNLKFKAEIADYNEYLNAIKKFVDLDLSLIDAFNNIENQGDLLKAILNIKEITRVDDEITIIINDIDIVINVKDEILNSVSFMINSSEVQLLFSYENKTINIIEEEYLNAKNILEFVDPILNTISKTNFAGNIEVYYLNEKLNIEYSINFENGIKAIFNTNYLGLDLKVTILENTIYLNVNGIKLKASFNDLEKLLDNMADLFKINMQDMSFDEILNSEKLIENFTFLVNGLYLQTFDAEISLYHNGNVITGADLQYKDLNVKLNLCVLNNEPLNISIENDYVDFKNVEELIKNITAYINSNNYNFDILFSYKNILISGYLGLINNQINADLVLSYNDLIVNIKIINNIIFAEFNGLKITCNLNEVNKLIEFIENEFGLNLKNYEEKLLDLKNEITKENIEEIIKNLIINYNENSFNITFEDFNLYLNLKDNKINDIKLKYIDLSGDITLCSEKTVTVDNEYYIDIVKILPLLSATKNTFEKGYISGDLTLNFTMFEEKNTIKVSYAISFVDEILAYINTTFKGLNIEIYYLNQTFYLNIAGLKVYILTDDINDLIAYINNTFNTNLNLNIQEFDLSSLNLDFITNIETINGYTNINLNNGSSLKLYFDEFINKINYNSNDFNIDINCTNFDKIIFENVDFDNYQPYTKITNVVSNILNTIKEKNFNITADTLIYDNGNLQHININLVFSAEKEFTLYGKISANEEIVEIYVVNNVLYAKYKELKISVSISSLKEILSLALQILGINPESIPFLDSIGEDINFDNIQNLIPEIDFGNPLSLLELIKSMSIEGNAFKLNLNGDKISDIQKEMNVILYTNESGLESVELNNIFINTTTYFNAVITKNNFVSVPYLTELDSFIDISNSSKLLKSILNTTSLNDFQIKGTINVVASVIGIDINMDIPMLVNVKLIDGKPIIYASFEIPVIGSNVTGFTKINVNNDVPYKTGDTSVKSRKLEVYYANDFVYFYRKDIVNQTIFASRTYEKTLKISTVELMSDPMYYFLQYGFGFSDDIMSEINKAIEKSMNRETPIDISKILLDYKNNESYQTIVINLAEIANNDMLDSATLDFYTTIVDNKDYFSKLCFDIYMPIASAFELNLKTNDLSLVNIGDELDISNINNFIEEYPYKENQFYEASDGNWGLASEKKYTLSFVTEYQNTPVSIEAGVGEEISIPSIDNFVLDDKITKKSYYFQGWYYSQEYKEKFTLNVMPRGDLTLYAKWDIITEYYRTLTLLGGIDGPLNITKLEGEYIELPTYSFKQETNGDITTTYSFQGWQDESGQIFSANAMPTQNKTLTAIWKVESVEITKELSIYDREELLYSVRIKSGEEIILPELDKLNAETKYYLDNCFEYEYNISVMPDENLKLFVRNKYTLKVISDYGEIINSEISLYQGQSYNLPLQNSYVYDDGEIRIDYTFIDYISDIEIDFIMPNKNITIIADWEILEREYFTITFDTRWYIPIGWVSKGILVSAPTEVQSVKVLQGDSLDLTQFVSTTQRKYTRISKTNTFKTESWGLEPFNDLSIKSGITILENVQSDTTLYACWKKQ